MDIVELRQYTMRKNQRDALIELFDREFIETQEAVGMKVIGQFRDVDNPDRFVWLRGYPDMAARATALQTFYDGPVWRKHRDAAMATIIDADNNLLLRPAAPGSGFQLLRSRPGPKAVDLPPGMVIATIYYFAAPVDGEFITFFQEKVQPEAAAAGATILAYFVTEPSKNTVPQFPLREGEHVFVWFSSFSDEAAHEQYVQTLDRSKRWSGDIERDLRERMIGRPEVLRLAATARSLLRP